MAMVTSMSPRNMTQTKSFEKRNIVHDPSISSYLNSAVLKLTQQLTQKATSLNDIEDGEIGVFGADKYFQGELEEQTTRKLDKGLSTRRHLLHEKDSSQVNHPYSSSYMVSDNICHVVKEKRQLRSSLSKSGALLRKIPRNQVLGDIIKGRNVKRFLTSLGCHCNDKASVETDELSVENRAHREEMTKPPSLTNVDLVQKAKSMSGSTSWEWAEEEKREDCSTFPVLKSNPGILAVKSDQLHEKKPLSLERKSNLLGNWDALIPKAEQIEFLSNWLYNNAESDATSDLFGIESFSTSENLVLGRQASDRMSSCMTPTTCYAPSEASIEWSVVTASAADCSMFSEYESVTGKPKKLDRMVRNARIGKAGKDMQKRGPGVLSGCTSLKAVQVVRNDQNRSTQEKAIISAQGQNELGPIAPASKVSSRDQVRFGKRPPGFPYLLTPSFTFSASSITVARTT